MARIQIVAELKVAHSQFEARLLDGITSEERAVIDRVLDRLRNNIHSHQEIGEKEKRLQPSRKERQFALVCLQRRLLMEPAELRSLVYQVYEAINARDLIALEELFDPQIIRHAAGEIGIESAKNAVTNAFATFPNKRFVVEDVLVEGDKAALRVSIQSRPMIEGQPQPVIMEIFRIENGRVAEIWGAGSSH